MPPQKESDNPQKKSEFFALVALVVPDRFICIKYTKITKTKKVRHRTSLTF